MYKYIILLIMLLTRLQADSVTPEFSPIAGEPREIYPDEGADGGLSVHVSGFTATGGETGSTWSMSVVYAWANDSVSEPTEPVEWPYQQEETGTMTDTDQSGMVWNTLTYTTHPYGIGPAIDERTEIDGAHGPMIPFLIQFGWYIYDNSLDVVAGATIGIAGAIQQYFDYCSPVGVVQYSSDGTDTILCPGYIPAGTFPTIPDTGETGSTTTTGTTTGSTTATTTATTTGTTTGDTTGGTTTTGDTTTTGTATDGTGGTSTTGTTTATGTTGGDTTTGTSASGTTGTTSDGSASATATATGGTTTGGASTTTTTTTGGTTTGGGTASSTSSIVSLSPGDEGTTPTDPALTQVDVTRATTASTTFTTTYASYLTSGNNLSTSFALPFPDGSSHTFVLNSAPDSGSALDTLRLIVRAFLTFLVWTFFYVAVVKLMKWY